MNKKSPAYVLAFMAAICLVFGAAIAVVNYATLGLLAKNEALHRNTVWCRAFLLPVAGNAAEDYQRAVDENLVPLTLQDAAGEIKGYRRITPGHEAVGFLVGGLGFWDRIEAAIVLTPDLREVINLQFMDQKETPGLGARVTEEWFTDQFKGRIVDWDGPADARLIVGPAPNPQAANRVDGITGATQTSMALARFLNSELNRIRALLPAALATAAAAPATAGESTLPQEP
ncbi:MAG TPA: FMN-binding protein [Kiritimatiellia bacterium]|jgi:Na+-transporting NADH:ubiquinone oxidoreductase subunit C|nr:FMN-binding protein [Kiritimatiellia bacterium]OQC58609.1 MAG: Na(+)-translocating NADH-quinone reductase subunit C [Verrucomicrobia bacterium ADurb.Bin018]MBP9572163.1 FMN-binding protein [Kiritimatiellia bacterium]HOD99952.1 FMN-binding protein [Kiritimatiellia bacterium]HOE36552.1 FMN-binding protein [Kiritimatiellia bacterium]